MAYYHSYEDFKQAMWSRRDEKAEISSEKTNLEEACKEWTTKTDIFAEMYGKSPKSSENDDKVLSGAAIRSYADVQIAPVSIPNPNVAFKEKKDKMARHNTCYGIPLSLRYGEGAEEEDKPIWTEEDKSNLVKHFLETTQKTADDV